MQFTDLLHQPFYLLAIWRSAGTVVASIVARGNGYKRHSGISILIRAQKSFSLADQLFNESSVAVLSDAMSGAVSRFPADRFMAEVLARFPDLDLKERIDWIVSVLENYLPDDFDASMGVLRKALPAPLDPGLQDDDFGQFIWAVPSAWVARHGCTEQRLDGSLEFLGEATKRFSAEMAIRPFLAAYPEATLAFMHRCAVDDNYHVRRFASEGIRPLLPWAQRVVLPLDQIVGVLDLLHEDSTRYVTRSVANNLNDLSKLDPDTALAAIRRWQRDSKQDPDELGWMSGHAMRTLLKMDHAEALSLFGYPVNPKFVLSSVQVPESVKVGEQLTWSGVLTSQMDQNLKVTLKLHYLKANGGLRAVVYKVTSGYFPKGTRRELSKRLSFKPVTTRALYPGEHQVELVVNGVSRARRRFELEA